MTAASILVAVTSKAGIKRYGCVSYDKFNFMRYPGGKQRILKYIMPYLPPRDTIKGKFVEPFVGSGAVFFALNPKSALLSDLNAELIDLYRGIKNYPLEVWNIYRNFPNTKKGYYKIRSMKVEESNLPLKAARTLYLNRTCFKGMWRHNVYGEFNVGYGGQDRRWVINEETLMEVSNRLKHASLKCSDFQEIIYSCSKEDFIFADPPYRPRERELFECHYTYGRFTYEDYVRLASALQRASEKGIRWALTISSHPDILDLYVGYNIKFLPVGTGNKPGLLTSNSGEALVLNYK